MITNGLGIIRYIVFLDDEFKLQHPDLIIEKKSDSPEEDKSIGDSSALKPVLEDFFRIHPDFHPSVFFGDSAFDTTTTYGFLKDTFHFDIAAIPYNPRNESTLKSVGDNLYGYLVCPDESSLDMKHLGFCREKGRVDRIKWGCPKMTYKKGNRSCQCKNPYRTEKKGRTTYT